MQQENPPFYNTSDADFLEIMSCGLRRGVLLEMISEYKFLSRRSYAKAFSELLSRTIDKYCGDEEYILVPLPTIRRHIRERGFDHIKLICEELVAKKGFLLSLALVRRNNTVQVGASAEVREKQAGEAYGVDTQEIQKIIRSGARELRFLLVDDVWTTGSSMRAARNALFKGLIECGLDALNIKISAICLAKNGGYEF